MAGRADAQGSGPCGREAAIAATAKWGNLSHGQVRVALRYYGDFREEVDERIAHNREEAKRQHAAWIRAQAALA
jgi:hypothetical protein